MTLTVDEDLLRAARKVALDRDTSVNQLVRNYLAGLVNETERYQGAVERLQEIFRTSKARIEGKTWTRAELHER